LANALLFDGASALEREVALGWDGAALSLTDEDGTREAIAWARLNHAGEQPGVVVIGHDDRPGWRLHIPLESPATLLSLLPKPVMYGGWIDRIGIARAAIAFAVVSAAVLAAVLTAPNWIGPMVPESWERRLGDAMVGDLERFACHTPEADAALAGLIGRLDPGEVPIDIYIANIDIPNAAALPGGKILVFDGLIAQADSPDELAGVIAHEIGHVRERHVMQALLRQFGLSILLSGADSGLGNTLGGLAAMSYSREAETAADRFSRKRLETANISPAGAAEFFARIRKLDPFAENEGWSYIASHPSSARREKEFTSAVKPGRTYVPALSAAEFQAVKLACSKDDRVEEFSFF
jgi:hypothetical protein